MNDYKAFRQKAFRFWERRRILYNVALVLPAFLGYAAFNDPHQTHYVYLIPLLILSAMGANVCYTFAYALEFVFGSDDPALRWLRFGRTMAFVCGVMFAMLLAFIGGWNIAAIERNQPW